MYASQAKPVGKERHMLVVGMATRLVQYLDRVVQVLKLAGTQKWRAELLESLDTAITECYV